MSNTDDNDPESVSIQRILARFFSDEPIKTAMARATLVVDENVKELVEPLSEANFRVLTPPASMPDPQIQKEMLGGRIIVTKNTKDFLGGAPVYDYGIISLEALRFIDPTPKYDDNQTAQLISFAIVKFQLVSRRSGFVLMLHSDGKHILRNIE